MHAVLLLRLQAVASAPALPPTVGRLGGLVWLLANDPEFAITAITTQVTQAHGKHR